MKIAIDCRSLRKRPVGVPNFLLSAINTIIRQKSEWTLYLLSNEEFDSSVRERLIPSPRLITIVSPLMILRKIAILWYVIKVPFIVRKLSPDIFYTPIPNLPFFLPKNVKTLITVHDMVYKRLPATMSAGNWWINFFLHDRSIRQANMLWAVSEYTKSEIESLFAIRKSNSIVVGSCVDKCIFNSISLADHKETNNKTVQPKYLLFVGTLEPRKNLGFLISLMPELILHGFSLVIVGAKGWGTDKLITPIGFPVEMQKKIQFQGFVSGAELLTLYRNASVYVSTALNEGFGLPQLEAMCCSCPVVSPHNSAMIEVVEGAGETVIGWNREVWINTILKVSNNREYYIGRGLTRAKTYNWEEVIARVTAYLKENLK